LSKARIYDELLPKVLHVDNSRAVLAAVASGAADAGVAFSSDAAQAGSLQTILRVPTARATATYVAAIVGRGRATPSAEQLLDFLSSSTARRCLKRCGFRAPEA